MKTIKCACHSHMLVLDTADFDCGNGFDGDNPTATLDISMWTTMPTRGTGFWKNVFYWPHWSFKFTEAWKALKGERYAEWVILDRPAAQELHEYVGSLLKEGVST